MEFNFCLFCCRTQEREEKEEVLSQLQLCLDLNDATPFNVDIDVDADAEKPTLEIKIKSKVPLLGKYWFLVSQSVGCPVVGSNPIEVSLSAVVADIIGSICVI